MAGAADADVFSEEAGDVDVGLGIDVGDDAAGGGVDEGVFSFDGGGGLEATFGQVGAGLFVVFNGFFGGGVLFLEGCAAAGPWVGGGGVFLLETLNGGEFFEGRDAGRGALRDGRWKLRGGGEGFVIGDEGIKIAVADGLLEFGLIACVEFAEMGVGVAGVGGGGLRGGEWRVISDMF